MIRLYSEQEFREGEKLGLPKDELKYFESIRRSRGPVVLFNRQGQVASGHIEAGKFHVEKIEQSDVPVYPLRMALGLPDQKTLKRLIPQISELGVGELILFSAERSQSGDKRLSKASVEKLNVRAVESARQCGRGSLLDVKASTLKELLERQQTESWSSLCFDEAGEDLGFERSKAVDLVLVGPEGGWSEKERSMIKDHHVPCHKLQTPIMRVETAAVMAASIGILTHLATPKLSGSSS